MPRLPERAPGQGYGAVAPVRLAQCAASRIEFSGDALLGGEVPQAAGDHRQPTCLHGRPILAIGIAHFMMRRFQNAQAIFVRSLQEKPNWLPTRRFLASCSAHLGQLDEAREEVRHLRTNHDCGGAEPQLLTQAEHRELFVSGLRLANDGAD